MDSLKIYQSLKGYPFGSQVFSLAVCFKAPYFSSIKPHITKLEKGHCKVIVEKRRRILNHIKTVHAIAMCNMAELCAGLAIDTGLDPSLRWIPKGMEVKYLKKAQTDLEAECFIDLSSIVIGENRTKVKIQNTLGQLVFEAQILMYVTKKEGT